MVRKIIARIPARFVEFIAAALAVTAVGAAAAAGIWAFRASDASRSGGSLWTLLLSDRATLGFARVALMMVSVYAIASIAALLSRGRWIKTFGTSGFEAEDARAIEDVAVLRQKLHVAEEMLEEARRLSWRMRDG